MIGVGCGELDRWETGYDNTVGVVGIIASSVRERWETEAVMCASVEHATDVVGSIGGPAARLAQDAIRKVEVLEYEELGMEAVWRIEVENFPAFIIIDDKGNDFFSEVSTPVHLR